LNGIVLQMMGGRFRNLMPSDLFQVGACARESLPARSGGYASEVSRGELKQLMHRCVQIHNYNNNITSFNPRGQVRPDP
jgi:hypothetical protein